MYEDALSIMSRRARETGEPSLFNREDVERTFSFWKTVSYHKKISLGKEEVVLKNAGHILGSAIIEIRLGNGKTIVFSGDLGNSESPLLQPTEAIEGADYMVIDSVYGDRNHGPRKEAERAFKEAVVRTVQRGGSVVVPAFALERTQELLYLLDELIERGEIPSVPVFLDSPLAIKVTEIFEKFSAHFSIEAQEQIQKKLPMPATMFEGNTWIRLLRSRTLPL